MNVNESLILELEDMNHISSLTLGVRVNTQQCLRETSGVFVVDSNKSRAGGGYKMNV